MHSSRWDLDGLSIKHSIIESQEFGVQHASNDSHSVRLHFGLSGDYDFRYSQLDKSYQLRGTHNNIMYSDGLDLEIHNKSKRIETFGIDFTPEAFIGIAQHGNDTLKAFAEKVKSGQSAILSEVWRPNSVHLQRIIHEMVHCPYGDGLKKLFLLSKSIELLVAQTDLYSQNPTRFLHTPRTKEQLFAARDFLEQHLTAPPSLSELALQVGLNEYNLKKGFKALFGTTVFGYLHQHRMLWARQLLLESDQSVKEIAYTLGYSSPQHFSKAFRKEFNTSPASMRKAPDSTL